MTPTDPPARPPGRTRNFPDPTGPRPAPPPTSARTVFRFEDGSVGPGDWDGTRVVPAADPPASPATPTGRMYADHFHDGWGPDPSEIAAIEQEAARDALRALREEVEGLPAGLPWRPRVLSRDAVLDAIDRRLEGA